MKKLCPALFLLSVFTLPLFSEAESTPSSVSTIEAIPSMRLPKQNVVVDNQSKLTAEKPLVPEQKQELIVTLPNEVQEQLTALSDKVASLITTNDEGLKRLHDELGMLTDVISSISTNLSLCATQITTLSASIPRMINEALTSAQAIEKQGLAKDLELQKIDRELAELSHTILSLTDRLQPLIESR